MEDVTLDEGQEQDIIELLAKQGLEQDDEGEDESFPTELPKSIEDLKSMLAERDERIGKRNLTIKKRTEATHRMQEEIGSLQQQIADLKNTSTTASNTEAQKQEYNETLEKWRNSVEEDPTKAIDFVNWQTSETQNKLVDYVASMQSKFDARLAEIEGGMNPERMENRSKIAQLKANPEYANFTDDQLLTVIKSVGALKPRGSIGGRSVTSKPSPEKGLAEARAKAKAYFDGTLG